MSISFASATGNLMDRLGKLGNLIKEMRSYQATQLSAMTDTTNGVVAQYNAESDLQALMGSAYQGLLNGAGSVGTFAQTLAAQTVNRMVFRDNPQLNQTLSNQNTLASLLEIIRQMELASASVLAMTIGATVGTFTGTGNGVINISTKRPIDGRVLENAFAETLTFTCASDAYSGRATEGNESFRVTGQGNQSDFFAFNWPLGSNAQTTLNAIDGNSDVASGNLLTNSGFNEFTANVPDNWTLVTGTAGTHLSEEVSITYDGAAALKLTGGSANETEIHQTFNISTGTTGTLNPDTQYSVVIFLRRDGTPADDGTLQIDLINGSNVTIQDNAGVDNSFTVDLTALTTDYTAYKGVFRTPSIMPSTYKLRLKLTTGLTDDRSVYLDKLGMGLMTQLYRSGPFAAVHAGSVPFLLGDYATVAITNSRGSGGTLSTWQTLLARLFPSEVYGNELLFPSSDSPTIGDSLIS